VVFASCNNEVLFYGCEKCRYVGWSSSIVAQQEQRNVLCFGKSQSVFTLACSRLTLEVWCVAFVKACS